MKVSKRFQVSGFRCQEKECQILKPVMTGGFYHERMKTRKKKIFVLSKFRVFVINPFGFSTFTGSGFSFIQLSIPRPKEKNPEPLLLISDETAFLAV
jgi:hypothetical protein